MTSRLNINQVFTPRSAKVNPSMYIGRPFLERLVKRAISRNTHALIFGESGNGKSWLYKKVLHELEIPYVVANCANASRLNSVTLEICSTIVEPGTVKKLGFSEEKATELSAYVAKGGVKHTSNFGVFQDEPLLEAFKLFSSAKPGKKIIVLDNLESIFDNRELMNELADIIILLDDERYSSCEVCLLIVGIPNGVLQFFREAKNSDSVANRIMEVDRVTGLDCEQVDSLIEKGFGLLGISITTNTRNELAQHVFDVTLGIAQRVHEYCECLAEHIVANDWKYSKSLLGSADEDWMFDSLRHCYQAVESNLNSRETLVARRNQVIYCIGKVSSHQFESPIIDALVRKEFPNSIPETNMGIGSILGELSSGGSPILLKNENTNTFSVRDPKFIMCIKMVLYKDPASQKVIKRNFGRG